MPILAATGVSKTYELSDHSLTVLNDVSFAVEAGASCAVIGPSGSGKSTLLGLCAGLDKPSSGSITLDDQDLGGLNEEALAKMRQQSIGFIFQGFELIPTLTALENVMVPMELRGQAKQAGARACELLDRVGLGERKDHYPTQLSGGEQQRVAIARAFVHEPRVLFADEPTGNLDSQTGDSISNLLFELNRDSNTTLILVTHDHILARRCEQVVHLRSGRIEQIETPDHG
ncbi:MAG: putative ABC transport system ATP-binding protein [Rhodothermales bacterium]|jgi:putative ABC transport system ATP-binding protein